MSDITIKINILAGAVIDDVAVEMVMLATKTGVAVEGDFNGVKLLASERTMPKFIVSRYHQDLAANSQEREDGEK